MKLWLSPTIYPRQCLGETIAAFSDLCSVSIVHEQNKSYAIEILPISPVSNEEVLTNEFLNYLLSLSIENHLINDFN
jgi:hypothetical protein